MADCTLCALVEKKDGVVFETDALVILLAPQPAIPGHLLVVPKKHVPIMEQVPSETLSALWTAASKATLGLFHAFQAGGTNVLVRNGPAAGQAFGHFSLEVLPRSAGDGLPLQWQPRQLGEEEMSTIELRVKEEAAKMSEGAAEPAEEAAFAEEKAKEKEIKKGEDYLIRQLQRLP